MRDRRDRDRRERDSSVGDRKYTVETERQDDRKVSSLVRVRERETAE